MPDAHPVQFSVDYPDRPLNRLTTAFRIFTVIPIAIVLATIEGYSRQWDGGARPPPSSWEGRAFSSCRRC